MYIVSRERESDINERIVEIIQDSICRIFGFYGYLGIRLYLENVKNLKLEDIPKNMDVFYQSLKEIFGEGGTLMIREEIEKRLSCEFIWEM